MTGEKKVYLVIHDIQWEYQVELGIFDSEKKAEVFIKEYISRNENREEENIHIASFELNKGVDW